MNSKKWFDLLLIIAVCIIVFIFYAGNLIDNDFWWHIQQGKFIVENHAPVLTDTLTFTGYGTEWYYQGWLSEVVLFAVYSAGGVLGVQLLMALTFVAMMVVLYFLIQDTQIPAKLFLIMSAGMLLAPVWTARPKNFSLILFALSFLIIAKFNKTGKRKFLAFLFPLAVLWFNTHGDAYLMLAQIVLFMGVNIVGMLSKDESHSQYTDNLCALIDAIFYVPFTWFLNPIGIIAFPKMVEFVGSQKVVDMLYIKEWQSPDFHKFFYIPLFIIFVTLIISFAVGNWKRNRPASQTFLITVISTVSVVAVLYSARFLGYATVFLIYAIAENLKLQDDPAILRSTRYMRFAIIGLLISIICSVTLLVSVQQRYTDPEYFAKTESVPLPHQAVEFVKTTPLPGNIINSYNQGAFLEWELGDHYQFFIDSRLTPEFGRTIFHDYLTVRNAETGWKDVLDKYQINTVWMEPSDSISKVLRESADWEIIYEDDVSIIFVRYW